MEMEKKLLQYGLQRSGTNFLEHLLKKKYKVKILNNNRDRTHPLQKHFRLYDEKDLIPEPQYKNEIYISNFKELEFHIGKIPDFYLIISKDPFSWLLSYRKWAKKCKWPEVNHHYVVEYNLFYGKWLEFANQTDRVLFVRYHDLIKNANEEMSRLELKMRLEKKLFLSNFSNSIAKVPQSSRFTKKKIDYYRNEKFYEIFSKKEIIKVNSIIDQEVVERLGYLKLPHHVL